MKSLHPLFCAAILAFVAAAGAQSPPDADLAEVRAVTLTEASFANPAEDLTGPAMLWKSRDPNVPPEPIPQAYPGVDKGDLLPAFLEAIQGRGQPGVSEPEAFAAMATCLPSAHS